MHLHCYSNIGMYVALYAASTLTEWMVEFLMYTSYLYSIYPKREDEGISNAPLRYAFAWLLVRIYTASIIIPKKSGWWYKLYAALNRRNRHARACISGVELVIG